jgi:hypothetical protein
MEKNIIAKMVSGSGNYLLKNQGSANAGKILVVGPDGNITLADMPMVTVGDGIE